ncbi:RluA family pseudouridine synthase [Thalassotalea eurytherma]|uniref:RNA pseudouridine synthase n=1 Tax=Thalassotalea eurytherma TaxID=1144278 RepID=A0ABQ6H4C6_9GAMM|nr:RluA family pseudouridine synthase [Thalassotalea eurytherma]GLX82369.1 RNA pseudouridine synthase [Thalassotalea eurytherma]
MPISDYFIKFSQDVTTITLPKRFTYPFCYEPHQLAEVASSQLQSYLRKNAPMMGNLGEMPEGKMYGVLVVKNQHGKLGFLAAYSGKEQTQSSSLKFVPQAFDLDDHKNFYLAESKVVNDINEQVKALESAALYRELSADLTNAQHAYQQQVSEKQAAMVLLKKHRKSERNKALQTLSNEEYLALDKRLSGQSIEQKKQLLALKSRLKQGIEKADSALTLYEAKITKLKKQRKKLSNRLQKQLFNEYQFFNAKGEIRNLNEIFSGVGEFPPAGTGDCAAPKLLQFAYKHDLTPITMAEFWWGQSPKSQIRQHQKYYPACQSKCGPLLGHMLTGLQLDDNPLLINTGENKTIDVLYEDEHLAVINKPEGLLSVPGKLVNDSVLSRMKTQYPEATGPLIVHRLDMSTSGLMVIALTPRANKGLQQQFISREVTKHYVALIEGHVNEEQGEITLPLRQDLDDRPRQRVCFEHGKSSLTKWQLIKHESKFSRLLLEPKTGRTHQLRMHCAHRLGLNMPIVGDDLYGTKANRLCLHAKTLSFVHPINKDVLTFRVEPNF